MGKGDQILNLDKDDLSESCLPWGWRWPGGVLPYITYTGMCRPMGS